ncbi:hypothetical protein H6P81_006662 [Aristolochia fimbriata]|uniref:Uncharacterized protein n=1 Tax=Aristolochia fimbriata TaxID=158543 RepID=A0AAV7EY68_ARIFI|nr:hypothetical protein H6P81_006662 [Aristolochia fimbriata]
MLCGPGFGNHSFVETEKLNEGGVLLPFSRFVTGTTHKYGRFDPGVGLGGHNLSEVELILAGGFDKRLKENVEYLEELKELAERVGVSDRVTFVTSCSTAERNQLLWAYLLVCFISYFGLVNYSFYPFNRILLDICKEKRDFSYSWICSRDSS